MGVNSGFIRIRYARMVPNQPLSSPVVIERVAGNVIMLHDGRTIELDQELNDSWRDLLPNGGEIEIESHGPDGTCDIYGKQRRFVCGGTSPIKLSLIPYDVNGYYRSFVGGGNLSVPQPNEKHAVGGNRR